MAGNGDVAIRELDAASFDAVCGNTLEEDQPMDEDGDASAEAASEEAARPSSGDNDGAGFRDRLWSRKSSKVSIG